MIHFHFTLARKNLLFCYIYHHQIYESHDEIFQMCKQRKKMVKKGK